MIEQVAETLHNSGVPPQDMPREIEHTMEWVIEELEKNPGSKQDLEEGFLKVKLVNAMNHTTGELSMSLEFSAAEPPRHLPMQANSRAGGVGKQAVHKGFFTDQPGRGLGGGKTKEPAADVPAVPEKRPIAKSVEPAQFPLVKSDGPAHWEVDIARQIKEKLYGLPREAQEEIISFAIDSILNNKDGDQGAELLTRGEARVRIESTAEQLMRGELAMSMQQVGPTKMDLQKELPGGQDTPSLDDIVAMYRANDVWRQAGGCKKRSRAPTGECGVPMPRCVLAVTAPDSAVPKGRTLVNIDFVSCTS